MPRTSERDLHPGLRGAVERLDHVRVDERVHLATICAGLPGAGVLRLAGDEAEHRLVQPERGDDQRVPLRRRAVAREQVEEAARRLRRCRVAR